MFPGTLALRAVDIQAGAGLSNAAKEDRLILTLKGLTGNVLVNESQSLVVATPAELQLAAVSWITKVRGGIIPNNIVGAGLENRFLHVTSAGNRGNGTFARTNSAPNAAALLPGLTQVVPIPNLTNVLAVENVINSEFFEVACLKATSCVGGQLSAVGTQVWSLLSATSGVGDLSGTSQAAPQVTGLAAYVWARASRQRDPRRRRVRHGASGTDDRRLRGGPVRRCGGAGGTLHLPGAEGDSGRGRRRRLRRGRPRRVRREADRPGDRRGP
jgi:hypothetical protein